MPLPVGSLGALNALPSTGIIHWSRGNSGTYPMGDRVHEYYVPLTQGYDSSTGVATIQARLPQGGVRPTFTTTDGITFTAVSDRGNSHGATMTRSGSAWIITGPKGDRWEYPIPADWQLADNGRQMQVGVVKRAMAYPVTLAYDANGEIISAASLLGTTTFTWSTVNGFRQITALTGPDGRTSTFSYGKFWNKPELTEIRHADGSTSTFAHDPTSRTLPDYSVSYTTRTEVTPNLTVGNARSRTSWYDSIGRVALVEDGMNRDQYWRPANNVCGPYMWRLIQHPNGSLHLPVFNSSAGLVANITYGSDTIDRVTLDAVKRTIASIDELGRMTSYQWFGDSQFPSRIDHPDGTYEVWTRQAGTGQPLSHTDRLGRTTTWERNATGLATAIIYPDDTPDTTADNPTARNDYNDAMQLVRSVDELGRVTEYRYAISGQPADATAAWDAPANHGYLVRIIAPGDVVGTTLQTTYTWNAATQDCIESIDPGGHRLRYAYDALHRHIRTDWDDASYATWTYGDPTGALAGLLIASRDRNGRVTAYEYDASGLQTALVRPDGTRLETAYDALGRVAAVTDAGEVTTYVYDAAGRRSSVTRKANASTTLTASTVFDSRNRTVATTDAYGRMTGTVYDINNRPIRTVRGLVTGALSWTASQASVDALLANTTWSSQDIGAVGLSGSTVVSGSTLTLTAAGKGARGTQDSFQWCAQPLPGEGSITVYVDPASTGRSGVMIRDGLGASAPFMELVIDPTTGIEIHHRYLTGQNTPWWHTAMSPIPRWLRLTRTSHNITAWTSPDGVAWTAQAFVPIPMGGDALAGVCQSSGSTTALATAIFANVAVVKTNALQPVRMQAWATYLQGLPRDPSANPAYTIEEATFDAEGQTLTRTDGRGIVTAYAYDVRGRVTAMTEAVGLVPATTGFTYDAVGNRLTVTSPRGVVTRTAYTRRSLASQTTEADGTGDATVVSQRTYTPTAKLATETDALARTTTLSYGMCCDRLVQIVDGAGFSTGFTYDAVGNRLTVTDGNALTSTTTYDARNRASTMTNAAGETSTYVYDESLTDGVGIDAVASVAVVLPSLGLGAGADGSAVAATNPTGATSYELRDGLGRTVARIDALGHVTRVNYDTVIGGLLETAQTDALGHTTRSRADGAGRVRQQVDAQNQQSTEGYDASGNQLSRRDAMGVGWDAIYDSRNRLLARTTTRQDAVATTSWSYDLDGNRLSETDATGKTESYAYDLRNRRTQLIDRLGGTTRFAYDAVGNLTQISDADNEPRGGLANLAGTTQYAYDARNLLGSEAFPSGQQGRTLRVYAYDAGRRLSSRQVGILSGAFSATPAFAGSPVTTTYTYDQANRLTLRGYGDGQNDGFTYDAAGRLTGATSARYASTVGRAYDAAGRLTSESLTLPDGQLTGTTLVPATWSVGYAYLDDNSLASQTYPTGAVVSRTYTARHELATVALDGTLVNSRVYDAGGRLAIATSGNGLVETRSYVGGDALVAGIAVPAVTGFGYTYDADGRKLTESQSVGGSGQTFAYDDAGRVTAWNAGTASQSWNLSLVGDWTSTTRNGTAEARTSSAVHEALTVGPNILAYDAQGNLTRDEHQTALAWDPENRLTRAVVTRDASLSGCGSVATYRYDALGRRIAKTVDATTTLFLPAGAQTVVEIDRAALPQTQADIDGATADGTLANMAQTPASGGILAGSGMTRINFQPTTSLVPAGYVKDAGRALAVRTNGLSYGWSSDVTAQAADRGAAVPLAEYATLVQAQTDEASATWSIALADGYYPVVVVAGDAASTNQTNTLTIGGQTVTDLTPATTQPGYEQGNFDGYAVVAQVSNGALTIAPAAAAFHAKLCFVEIGARSATATTIDQDTRDRLAAMVARMNAQTGASPEPVARTREYVYGSYVDEVVAYQQTVNGAATRYYPHHNHLYSVAALTNAAGAVVELYSYDAYGKQTITAPAGGIVRAKSAVGWNRGFTGYVADQETGLFYARNRMYSPTLGRFASRDAPVRRMSPEVALQRIDANPGISLVKEPLYALTSDEEYLSLQRDAARFGINITMFAARLGWMAPTPRVSVNDPSTYTDGYDLYRAYFIPGFLDPSGNDCPGCDVPSWAGGNTLNSHAATLACCAAHDECYRDNGCTASSWASFPTSWRGLAVCLMSPCCRCNLRVVACLAGAATHPDDARGDPLYYCPRQSRYINIPGDFPTVGAAMAACCN